MQTISRLLELQPTVIRGNASEILAVAGSQHQTRGVDTTAAVCDAEASAAELALSTGCVVAVSGATDLVRTCSLTLCPDSWHTPQHAATAQVTDGKRTLYVSNGVSMMTLITAAGCSVTALIAAFVSAAPEDPLFATAAALSVFG